MGGLGNQMFQYAAAKHLAIINDTELKIDGTNFKKLTANREHTLQLARFNISAPQASKEEIRQLISPANTFTRICNFFATTFGTPSSISKIDLLFREPEGSQFKQKVLELKHDRYLVGYFNSYKYFEPIRDVLTREYTPREDISAEGNEIFKLIESTNSVSIHIRRGDYVTDAGVYKCIEGIITEHYYLNAVELIASRVHKPHFFVFSNDMPWVKENFKIPYGVTYVDFNSPQRGFEDLWLMSRCKHNITAGGSTFSWWAAYLNPNIKKIVVRTENISNDSKYNHPDDYFPSEWASVKSY